MKKAIFSITLLITFSSFGMGNCSYERLESFPTRFDKETTKIELQDFCEKFKNSNQFYGTYTSDLSTFYRIYRESYKLDHNQALELVDVITLDESLYSTYEILMNGRIVGPENIDKMTHEERMEVLAIPNIGSDGPGYYLNYRFKENGTIFLSHKESVEVVAFDANDESGQFVGKYFELRHEGVSHNDAKKIAEAYAIKYLEE